MPARDDFDTLVAAYADDLYRYAYWLCRNEHNAEDLVQETLMRAWRSFRSLRDLSAAKAWLLTTLRREHYRRKPSAQMLSFDEHTDLGLDAKLHELPAWDDSLDAEQTLKALAVQYREVLVLQLQFGYSTQEIASLLEITVPAVANRLLRARRALLGERSAHVVALRKTRT